MGTNWENSDVLWRPVEAAIGLATADGLASRLARYGQEHLLRDWDNLADCQRVRLAEQIERIDFPQLARLLDRAPACPLASELAERAEPPPAWRLDDDRRRAMAADARRHGEAALRAGQVGAIVVAGGQGTRLGAEVPKGVIPVGPVSKRSLFQILFERVLAIGNRYGAPIPLYLMTSPATHAKTVEFLDEHAAFGLRTQDLTLFRQGVMPAVCAETGRILLAQRDSLCLSPNGHGGMLEALAGSGALDDALARGVRHFFYCQIDNPLAPCCDPELIGFHLLTGSEMTTLSVAKLDPLQRVGNIVAIDGGIRIVEYSELPATIASQRNSDGSLRLWAGNTGMHVFDAGFLQRAAALPEALPYHRALKATAHLDADGRLVTPTAPNAIKFERFIFDLLPLARTATVVEGARAEVFAPVKNASGQPSDTPETAQAAIAALHRRWLLAAGANIADDCPVEISPFFALDPTQLADKLPGHFTVTQPTYLA